MSDGVQDHTEIFHIRHHEMNRDGLLAPRALFGYLQETAANHALNLGCGVPFLASQKLLWVLSALRIENIRQAGHSENIHVQTWCSGLHRLFALREFSWRDDQGNVLGYGSSHWLLLSAENLRPRKPEHELIIPLPDPIAPPFFPEINKIPRHETSNPTHYTVHDSQIDINQHLNNAEYTGYVQDWLYTQTGISPQMLSLQIHFLSELRAGDTVSVSGTLTENQFYIEGIKANQICCFQCLGTL